jgi:hypothetical protein
MKSAVELAMERLNKEVPTQKLTSAQRAAIADLDSLFKSRIAERETFLQGLLVKAQSQGDFKEVAELQSQLSRDLQTIREEWDAKKNKVWETP